MLTLLLAGACGRCEETPGAEPEAATALVSVTYSARGILHPFKEGRTGDVLVEDIREHVAPGIWEKEGVFLEIRDRTLTVSAPQAVHDELAKFLEERRAAAAREDR
jgi:hypothetical protein